jgi:hypothetical protein
MKRFICTWLMLLATASADSVSDIIGQAEKLFNQGHEQSMGDPVEAPASYREAAELYTLICDDPEVDPGRAHLNAGNAWFSAGVLGEAVYHYRASGKHRPWDANLRHNLNLARNQSPDLFAPRKDTGLWVQLKTNVHRVPLAAGLLLFAGAHLLCWGYLAVCRLNRKPRGLRWVVASAVILGVLCLWPIVQQAQLQEGVVIADEVMPRQGDHEVYPAAFSSPIHAGMEFKLLEMRQDWLNLRLATGDSGWVPVATVRLL